MADGSITPARSVRRHGMLLHPMPGLVRINRSVGAGGANARADTAGIQTALNAVPAVYAGADGALAVDGLVGPKTLAAIKVFQSRWLRVVDSRADPRGPTLRVLNDMAGVFRPAASGAPASAVLSRAQGFAPPTTAPQPKPPTPAEAAAIAAAHARHQRVYGQHLPLVHGWMGEAVRVKDRALAYAQALASAKGAASPPMAADSPERRAFMLMAKYFRLHESKPGPALAAVTQAGRVLTDINTLAAFQLMQQQPPTKPGGPDFRIFVCLWKVPRVQEAKDAGYAFPGGAWAPGWNTPSGWINDAEVDRRTHQEFTHQIFLLPSFDNEVPDMQRAILVHEMAHAAGPAPGTRSVDLNPERYVHEAAFATLATAQRLRAADCYSAFVLDLAIGTQAAITAQRSNSTIIPFYPSTNMILDWDGSRHIDMPPPGHPVATQLAYPGGFA